MKRTVLTVLVLALVLAATATMVWAADPIKRDAKGNETGWESSASSCTTIQDGTLEASDGSLIEVGYDSWGYNYQAHMFNGLYCDSYRDAAWCQPYEDVSLIMKWDDGWLANTDCDGDDLLDRHFGFPSYIGSGAWLTNHQSGQYELDGKTCTWTYFVKIVAAPTDAVKVGDVWYNADAVEVGPAIWDDFAIIQQVENDPCAGIHGLQYLSPDHPGLGNW